MLWCWGVEPPAGALPEPAFHVSRFAGGQTELGTAARDAHALVVRRGLVVDEEVLVTARELRVIVRAGSNTENIDLEAAHRRAVTVTAVPMHIDMAVAEHALALMLVLAKRLLPSHEDVARGRYSDLHLVPHLTSEAVIATNWMAYASLPSLYGRRLGLIGLGEIGSAVAQRARAFGMEVRYFRRHPFDIERERAMGVTHVSLDELLASSDFVSLHVPHTTATEHLVDRSFLQAMKPSAFLINVSRGGVIDEHALASALQEGEIAGAGLDVFSHEPLPVDSELISAPNVVLTPHTASGTDLVVDVERVASVVRHFGAEGREDARS